MSTVKDPAPGVGRATTADLANVKTKAELIDGKVVHLMPTGSKLETMLTPNPPCLAGVLL